MKKLTVNKVKQYFAWRTDEKLSHCPEAIVFACNEACYEFSHDNALDLMKLVFFNEPVSALHTHNYSFHTATGRHIIETIIHYYNEH
tara:strand:+ start:128 stop:388 length:261 start_codon:yes stop_codon:yes gene_type:complete